MEMKEIMQLIGEKEMIIFKLQQHIQRLNEEIQRLNKEKEDGKLVESN